MTEHAPISSLAATAPDRYGSLAHALDPHGIVGELDQDLDDLHATLRRYGNCVGHHQTHPGDDDWWYDDYLPRGRNARAVQRHRAEQACQGCPVKRQCLTFALITEHAAGASHGYWAGTIPEDRQRMLAVLTETDINPTAAEHSGTAQHAPTALGA
ncbi:WhiB family transcriptional regulator [Saccharopolyspora griseoalba]|uniref:WhiB family transcriptional regulator n=1 Tax=Saccharopolyspora griseoalba TaxID=1431848 RepID=A0ABW2LTG3_9PSEU